MPSLTAIVPALNEEGNLAETIHEIVPVLEKQFNDYEILIFDDGSSDQTGSIADALYSKNKKVKVIHNPKTMGLGYNYKKGVELAKMDYIIMIPGDNEITAGSFVEMFKKLGNKDIVIPYTVNIEIRPLGRQILSKAYTMINNLLFGLNVKYFNGPVIHRRAVIQSIGIQTDSFSYQTELLVKMIKGGYTFEETGMVLKERKSGRSKALRPKNVMRVFKSILNLFFDVHFKKSPLPKPAGES